jgi:hypothetical protein
MIMTTMGIKIIRYNFDRLFHKAVVTKASGLATNFSYII